MYFIVMYLVLFHILDLKCLILGLYVLKFCIEFLK